jgi:hypothetical protein
MDRTQRTPDPWAIWLSWGAIAGVVLFNLGWLLAGAVQSGGYSVASHDVSDLAAPTAQAPAVMLTAQGLAGVLTIAFALFALRPALAVPGRGTALGAWLLAASLRASTTSPTPSSVSTAGRPTRAAPQPPPPAPGTARCTSRSPCSAPSRRSRPPSSSPPGCARRRAGATWPGPPCSSARCSLPSSSPTRRSKASRAAATSSARRSCLSRSGSPPSPSACASWQAPVHPRGPGGTRTPLGVGHPEQHVSVARLVEPTPASDRLAPELGASGVLVQVALEECDRFHAVVDGAGTVAAGLADRVPVRPATRPRDVHHAVRQALVVEIAFDADAIGHGRRLQGWPPSQRQHSRSTLQEILRRSMTMARLSGACTNSRQRRCVVASTGRSSRGSTSRTTRSPGQTWRHPSPSSLPMTSSGASAAKQRTPPPLLGDGVRIRHFWWRWGDSNSRPVASGQGFSERSHRLRFGPGLSGGDAPGS